VGPGGGALSGSLEETCAWPQTGKRVLGVHERTLISAFRLREDGKEASTSVARVLLIEDDGRIRALVEAGLAARGFSVIAVPDGTSAIGILRARSPDLVLLDLMLPDVDGFALLAAIRATHPRLPVIALTARDDERSKLDGFAGGADDYVTKPFSLAELAARIKARLRWREEDGTRLAAGPLTLDLANHRASLAGQSVPLSARESALLASFFHRAGDVLTREQLLRLVWELDFDPGSNVVDVYVAALRRKLGPSVIETVRGRGYRMRVSALELAGSR
jgi:two-component system copper resistance phosphate regulon response regulator CusR